MARCPFRAVRHLDNDFPSPSMACMHVPGELADMASWWCLIRRLEHGYPTPSLARDNVLAEALPWLRKQSVWSRGRFGSYKYEVGHR